MKTKLRYLILPVLLWVGFFALPVSQTGCAAPSERVVQVQTLKAVGHTAEAAVATSAQLYAAHQITDKQARQVMDIYDGKFLPAFRIAVNAVNADISVQAPENLITLATELSTLVLSFSAEKQDR